MNLRLEESTQASLPTIDLDLWGILYRRYQSLALGLLLGCLSSYVYYLYQNPVYESSLVALISQRSSELASTGTNITESTSPSIQDEVLSTQVELFRSLAIVEAAIENSQIPLLAEELQKGLSITKGGVGIAKNASVLKVSYRAQDPQLAVEVLQALYESYQEYVRFQAALGGSQAAELIAETLKVHEEELVKLDTAYREYVRSLPGLINSSGDGQGEPRDVHSLRLATIENELSDIRRSLTEVRARQEILQGFVADHNMDQLRDTDIISLLTEGDVNRLRGFLQITSDRFETNQSLLDKARNTESARVEYQHLLRLLGREKVFTAHLGSGHPSVTAIRAEIDSIRDFMKLDNHATEQSESIKPVSAAQMLDSLKLILENDLSALMQRESELLELSEHEADLAKHVDMQLLNGTPLKSNLKRAQARYDELSQRLQEINLSNAYAGFTTALISKPTASSRPVWPNKTRIAMFGLLLGGMASVIFALFSELRDRAFRSPEDVESATGTSIMAHLPRLLVRELPSRRFDSTKILPAITTYHAPRTTDAETFRVLRTELLYMAKRDRHKVFMVTSPSPADGKSTTIANLAVSLAQAGRRVLLVDGDLRRPKIGKLFGLSNSPGLSDYLMERASFDQCCAHSPAQNLTLCPEGTPTPQPAELLESPRFLQFIAHARKEFDLVLIDTPPILAVADPVIAAEVVDACMLVVRIEKNNRQLIERACQILRDHNVALLGIIVNAAHSRIRNYAYSSYNYYRESEYCHVGRYRKEYEITIPAESGCDPNENPA